MTPGMMIAEKENVKIDDNENMDIDDNDHSGGVSIANYTK